MATVPGRAKISEWGKSPSMVERIMAHIAGRITTGRMPGGTELPSNAEYAAAWEKASEQEAMQAKQRLYSAYPGLVAMRGSKFYVR